MSGKHTPGPWEPFPPSDPTEVKSVYGTPGMDESKLTPVTRLGPGVNRRANAALIAAAPELLEALEKVMRLVDDSEEWWMDDYMDKDGWLTGLIAKAKGEQA